MLAAAAFLPSVAFIPGMAKAQPGAVVQPLPSAAAVERLNSNLARLSRSPQDVEALLGAGHAALDLGDVQAANGFFTRANMVNSNLGAAKLGLAVVQLALKQPQEAAANFDAAERLGATAQDRLADRGLAYDLTGQQAKAQRDYQAALRADPTDSKAIVRYALSLGISGHLAEADKVLEPALRDGDREAWRFRAFIYAMNGRQGEARNIIQSVMPKGLADALDPYMARVSLLTPAQKAAAAHYGDFPANVLRMNAPTPATAVAAASAPAAAAAQPQQSSSSRRSSRSSRAAQPRPEPTPTPTPSPRVEAPPPLDIKPPVPAPVQQVARAQPAPATPRPMVQPTLPPARPVVQQAAPAPQQPASPPPAPAPASERSLAAALSELTVPAAEQQRAVAAVDLNAVARLQADKAKAEREAKAKAEREAKAKAEAERKKKLRDNPARIWVQIAAGKNESALAFDLRRFRRTYAEAIGDEAGWTYPWGQTNRLLIGPYRNADRAKAVVDKIKASGGDAFTWQSDAGEEVQKIGGK